MLASRRRVGYEPSIRVGEDEYLSVLRSVVHTSPTVAKRKSGTSDVAPETDPAMDAFLQSASSLDVLPARDLADFSPAFYAVVRTDSDGSPLRAYIQRTSKRNFVLRPGPLLFAFSNQRLRKVEEDGLFRLEESFEIVVEIGGSIDCLNQDAFEKLYRDVDFLKERAPHFAQAFSRQPVDTLGDPGLIVAIGNRAKSSVRQLHRLRAVYESKILDSQIDLQRLTDYADSAGVQTVLFGPNGDILTTPHAVDALLKLLAEDYATGPLTGDTYEISAKRIAQ
jgi:hypothetical protein